MNHLQVIAADILVRHGVDFATVQRAGGWTNAVWLADNLVLRLSTTLEKENLLREARLAAFFPPAVGYPTIVATGKTAGFAWSLATRLPGQSLGEAWDDLGRDARAIALQGLWARAQAVHTVDATAAETIVSHQAWFNVTDADEARAGLTRLTQAGILTAVQSQVLREALERFWRVLPTAPCVLCHGDLTLDNALWHAGQVISLLDFEFAVMAPVQLDLNHLVKCAFGSEDISPSLSTADDQGTRQLRQVVTELARPLLVTSESRDLLMGYAILLELWLLESWLAQPEGEGPLEQWAPLRRLRSLANGTGGYLVPLISG